MENKKQHKGCSSSSLASQLFGPPKSDVLASIFPPSKGVGRNYACSEVRGSWQKEPSGSENQKLNTPTIQDNQATNKDGSSIYEEERAEPSYLSSSLYYGGQETYLRSTTHQTSYSYPKFKKDDGEDDSSGAARGNWWQGSLYY
ncbi:uncharacterized protein LOC141622926 [Silene latifolia]|uniref:uncharacterized protein LOC141622926 n=1 Tax=Silene latifolia TaxID=37657 RepID=UPI003D773428